ncbi:hypothetical protein [Sphaerisporangium sp. TRM90804]|uniref:hypothetical protein n=1 Tax=Sphaerisporangium sp. TRM90804 TaxID=3031113 RepID=UPI00244BA833|nr:hypothetical protein [Sphaerisporangium sp. TRM90804]MDH2429243.1 hypothetical protein [Sphaerisporangium sp. TRM90804]
MTLAELTAKYGRRWQVSDAVGGGWYAVRRNGLSPGLIQRGLSNVRCAATLEELAGHLMSEAQLEALLAHDLEYAGVLPPGGGAPGASSKRPAAPA